MPRELRVFLAICRHRFARAVQPRADRVYRDGMEIIPAFDPTLPKGVAGYSAGDGRSRPRGGREPR